MALAVGFTEADLIHAAGSRSFERGLHYVDLVKDLNITATKITAMVSGTYDYMVRLTLRNRGLGWSCTCPQGREGFFCKHCVAVGLSALAASTDRPRRIEAARAKNVLDSWLESLSKQELLSELRGLLDEDEEMRRRFELRAATAAPDAATVRWAVGELVAPRDYVSHSEADEYAGDVREAAAAIGKLIDAGRAADAIQIAREAIALVIESFGYGADSSGSMTGTAEAADELMSVHLRACEAAPPDPVSLGDYLAGLLLGDDYGFGPDLGDYDDLLGEPGFARLRARIAAAYKENPKDWNAKGLMESLITAEGDVDAIVAFYAADLDDRGWNHLRICQELDEAGRSAEALGWAERGIREAAWPDPRLVEYLAGRYASADRTEDVLSLRRARFKAERTLANYQLLRQAAADAGRWPAERHKALKMLDADARGSPGITGAWAGPVLVDALLDDGDLDAAWAAAAGKAAHAQWLRLADAAVATRPADALAVYLKAIERLKKLTGDDVYEQIASLLKSARACHEALGTIPRFERYLAAFRADQRRKRNLMKILDRNGL